MPTPQEIIATNAAAILEQAAALDGLIASFRTIAADVDAREAVIRKAMHELRLGSVPAAGQERLALAAQARMVDRSLPNTVSELAAKAWEAFTR